MHWLHNMKLYKIKPTIVWRKLVKKLIIIIVMVIIIIIIIIIIIVIIIRHE